VQADNRRNRIAQLEWLIEEQRETIERLLDRLPLQEPSRAGAGSKRPMPRIY
jgi:hypothetical protein